MKYGYLFLAFLLTLALHDYLFIKRFQDDMGKRFLSCLDSKVKKAKQENPKITNEHLGYILGGLASDCSQEDLDLVFYGVTLDEKK